MICSGHSHGRDRLFPDSVAVQTKGGGRSSKRIDYPVGTAAESNKCRINVKILSRRRNRVRSEGAAIYTGNGATIAVVNSRKRSRRVSGCGLISRDDDISLSDKSQSIPRAGRLICVSEVAIDQDIARSGHGRPPVYRTFDNYISGPTGAIDS